MARAVLREIVFGLAATSLLLGCVEGGGKSASGDGPGLVAASGKKKAGAQDVEAPEVYQTTDSALWDGRPSLGGIWVAAPDVTNPERALMFNPATGKSVTGALFKRERDNPGPRLQLSSDAAEALGILAGQPTEIRVTALRKEEVAEAAPAEDVAAAGDPAATDPAAPAAEPAKDGDAAAIASAALDAVDAGKAGEKAGDKPASDAAAKDGDAGAAAAAGTAAAVAEGAADAAAVVDPTPKKKTWKERRAEAKAAREAKKKAAAEAKAAAAAAAAGTAAVEGEVLTATPDAAAAALAPIESAPLDARTPDVAKAADKAATKASDKPASKSKPAAEAAPAEPAAEAAPPAATGPARPIQVASFSKEDNAKRATEALAKIGITATPQKSEKAGKAVWGVVVMGDAAMLQKIKDAGFADAYFLK